MSAQELRPSSDPKIPADDITQSVKSWYDQFGWKKNENGVYNDSALFSQTRPIGNGLYELMSHISILDRLPGGDFILDAASGAIPHPEYMAFSWYFTEPRVCRPFDNRHPRSKYETGRKWTFVAWLIYVNSLSETIASTVLSLVIRFNISQNISNS